MDYFVVLTSGGSAGGQPLSWGERQIEMERETVRGERERERDGTVVPCNNSALLLLLKCLIASAAVAFMLLL